MLWQVHTICDGNDVELRVFQRRPVEEVVYYILFSCQQLIELVHQNDAIVRKVSLVSGNDMIPRTMYVLGAHSVHYVFRLH
jgi:hypothetical protein